MKYQHHSFNNKEVEVQIASFSNGNEVSEYHIILQGTQPTLTYKEQLNNLTDVYNSLLTGELKGASALFKRYFLSDAANQGEMLLAMATEYSDCALSIVEQPPLNGTKIALWVYLQTNVQSRVLPNGLFEAVHGNYRHFWGGSAFNRAANSEYQTRLLLNDYVMQLMEQGCTLADHCIRIWFFVQNVDVNYAGVVKARNEVFSYTKPDGTYTLHSQYRHWGPACRPESNCADGYLCSGWYLFLHKYSISMLPSHLNPTYEYGVSFERGTCVKYGDRRQVFISGTASINNKGEVVYPGDIRLQTHRMWENVEVLLQEAECTFDDLAQMIVYLRDTADYQIVKQLFDERFPQIPKVILLAPVCRPGWLIEMECIATKADRNEAFANY